MGWGRQRDESKGDGSDARARAGRREAGREAIGQCERCPKMPQEALREDEKKATNEQKTGWLQKTLLRRPLKWEAESNGNYIPHSVSVTAHWRGLSAAP